MKTLILLFLSISCCLGQGVKEIIVESQQANEPPGIPGPSLFQLTFKQIGNGDFTASEIREYPADGKKSRKRMLTKPITLTKSTVDQTVNWIASTKSSFQVNELGLDPALINQELAAHPLAFTDRVESDFVVKVDSFSQCASFDGRRTMFTGGMKMNVIFKLTDGVDKVFNFEVYELGTHAFNLRDYLLLYPLFKDKLPSERITEDFFCESKLVRLLLYYLEITECEGFYYAEFRKAHPAKTPLENRSKAGWNFKEYRKNRKSSE